MRQLQDIADERDNTDTIVQLTNAFQGLASMQIAKTKTQVIRSQAFFDDLWRIYSQLRVDSLFRFGRQTAEAVDPKHLYIVITATGGFSGDIDERVVGSMLKNYDPAKNDIIVIGHHGSVLLEQRSISYKKYFDLPKSDISINVEPLVRETRAYRGTTVFYQTYKTLMSQEINSLELTKAIQALGARADQSSETISQLNYIFEPSMFAVVAHLERSMLQITLSQLIFDSKLAQYASRFRAMSAAHDRSDEALTDLKMVYNRTRRGLRDKQLKEIVVGLKKANEA
ncbi:MAG: F0F1 ATP synthase subunit gamma [Candidatus Saccharimonadales bacterium]